MYPETVEALAVVLEGYRITYLTGIREKPSADLPRQLKVPECNSYWVYVVALLLCSYRLIGYR